METLNLQALTPDEIGAFAEEDINALTPEIRQALTFPQRQALWQREIALRQKKPQIPEKEISPEALDAIELAQEAMDFTNSVLVLGSVTRNEDLLAEFGRDGATRVKGRNVDGYYTTRNAVNALKACAPLEGASLNYHLSTLRSIALQAGVAKYYGMGNCSERASTALCYLVENGSPGLKITYCSSTVGDHEYVMVEGKDKQGRAFKAICDSLEKDGQAGLFEDHRYFFGTGATGEAYEDKASFEITEENRGTNLLVEAFKTISPDILRMLKPSGFLNELSKEELDDVISNQTHDQAVFLSQAYIAGNRRFTNPSKSQSSSSRNNLEMNPVKKWEGQESHVFESPLTATETRLNPAIEWPQHVPIIPPDFSQDKIEALRQETQQRISDKRPLYRLSMFEYMLEGAKLMQTYPGLNAKGALKLFDYLQSAQRTHNKELAARIAERLQNHPQIENISLDRIINVGTTISISKWRTKITNLIPMKSLRAKRQDTKFAALLQSEGMAKLNEIAEIDARAKEDGMLATHLREADMLSNAIENGSRVILKSEDGSRAYIQRNRPGANHNHWKVICLSGTQQIQMERNGQLATAQELSVDDHVSGRIMNTQTQTQNKGIVARTFKKLRRKM